jgi:hypothetical protein
MIQWPANCRTVLRRVERCSCGEATGTAAHICVGTRAMAPLLLDFNSNITLRLMGKQHYCLGAVQGSVKPPALVTMTAPLKIGI